MRAALGLLAAMPLHQRPAQRLQRLRITTPPTFARQTLVPRLEGVTRAHPEIEPELLLGNGAAAVFARWLRAECAQAQADAAAWLSGLA